MTSAELIELLHNPRPVRFGDLIFPGGIRAITARRIRPSLIYDRDIAIVQAEAVDSTGSTYIINPHRLTFADSPADQDQKQPTANDIFSKRLELLPIFHSWCRENGVAETPESLIAFFYSEDLIDAEKAYHLCKTTTFE